MQISLHRSPCAKPQLVARPPSPVRRSSAAPPALADFINGNNRFSLKILSQFKGNALISGLNIRHAFLPVYQAAKGDTQAQLRAGLCFPEGPPHALSRTERELKQLLQRSFDHLSSEAELQSTPKNAIFTGVGKKLAPQLRFFEDNLKKGFEFIFFWNTFFPLGADRPQEFNTGKKKVSHPMLQRTFGYPTMATSELSALGVPFVGNDFTQLVILPKPPVSLDEIENKLAADPNELSGILRQLKATETYLQLPKIALKKIPYELIPALGRLGITHAFEPRKSHFNGNTIKPWQTHKTQMGSLANMELGAQAAGTNVSFCKAMSDLRGAKAYPTFFIDRPYLSFILHFQTQTILAAMRIVDPTPFAPK